MQRSVPPTSWRDALRATRKSSYERNLTSARWPTPRGAAGSSNTSRPIWRVRPGRSFARSRRLAVSSRPSGSGKVVDAVGDVADAREKRLAQRKTPIVGVSEFPNLHEAEVERDPVSADEIQRLLQASIDALDLGAHGDGLRALVRAASDTTRKPGALTDACLGLTLGGADMYSVATALQHGQPDLHVEPVLQWRAAEVWEQLRDRSDRNAVRPLAFLANLGVAASHKARSTWARNLLASAGVEAGANDGFSDVEALVAGWERSSAALAVVCGSDEDYATWLEQAVDALKKAGCPVVLVAGRPGDREAALREAGVSDFVFVGADVLTSMTRVLDAIEVQR